MSELSWIAEWYREHCDGTWEHQYGVEIGTLDNPGWRVEITGVTGVEIPFPPRDYSDETPEGRWVKCSLNNGQFKGYGDPESLERMIRMFREWVT